jgi:hypothetical protein
MATRFFIPFHTLAQQDYHLTIEYHKSKTLISMQAFSGVETTDDLPAAIRVLKQKLPNIFTSQCFNDQNLSFFEEAQHTEIGHLFEHILLEHLCATKAALGFDMVEFAGVTRWNWHKNPRGSFSIEISANQEDRIIFNEALKKTIHLMNQIFEESNHTIHPMVNDVKLPLQISNS